MITLTKKFSVNANECLLNKFKDDIALEFGNYYKTQIDNHESIILSADIICDGLTTFQVRSCYGVNSAWNDLIGDSVLSFPRRSVAQIISSSNVTGTITFKLE